jgi:SAM-dependent methyltransferase
MNSPDISEERLLADINKDLPPGIDWKQGAKTYLSEVFQQQRPEQKSYLYTKPFAVLGGGPEDISHKTFADLMQNFINLFSLLALPGGSRVLDVACGSGWISQFLTKLGYDVVGIDIAPDMIDTARERVKGDQLVPKTPEEIDRMFVTHDIEADSLQLARPVDAAILESCLHHFLDPVSALRNIREALAPNGIVLILEGECRTGPLKAEYTDAMDRYHTIERPYTRNQLTRIMDLAGLPFHEFFCPVNGWYSPRAPETGALPLAVEAVSKTINKCVCAPTEASLKRILPWWQSEAALHFVEGFSPGAGSKLWVAPYGRIRVRQPLRTLALQVATVIPATSGAPQNVSLYGHGDPQKFCFHPLGSDSVVIEMNQVPRRAELILCSDAAFSPAWSGSNDLRILSFSVEVLRLA